MVSCRRSFKRFNVGSSTDKTTLRPLFLEKTLRSSRDDPLRTSFCDKTASVILPSGRLESTPKRMISGERFRGLDLSRIFVSSFLSSSASSLRRSSAVCACYAIPPPEISRLLQRANFDCTGSILLITRCLVSSYVSSACSSPPLGRTRRMNSSFGRYHIED